MRLALVRYNMLTFLFKQCFEQLKHTLLVCSFSGAGVSEAITRVDKQTRTRFSGT